MLTRPECGITREIDFAPFNVFKGWNKKIKKTARNTNFP